MVADAVMTVGFIMVSMRGRALVPSRMQSMSEVAYEFIANMMRDAIGHGWQRYFPFVFTLFIFIFVCNMLGMIPGFFTVTSHVAVTAALAVMVFVSVIIIGFAANGLHFLKLFVPDGVPAAILPLVVVIEIISFLSRTLSQSIRLFANMLAGHITLKVFGGFVVMLLGAGGAVSALAPLPIVAAVALTSLEVLVAFLQAYVFTMLTCMYLNDALHPGH